MEIHKRSSWLLLLLGISLLAATLQGVQGEAEQEGPSESECRPYIEKALKELETGEDAHKVSSEDQPDHSEEDAPTVEITTDDSTHQNSDGEDDTHEVEGADEAEEAEADDKTAEFNEKYDGKDDSKEATEAAASVEDKDDDGKDDGDDTKSDEVGDDDKASAETQNEVDTKEDPDSREEDRKSEEQDQGSKEDGDGKDSIEEENKQSEEDNEPESVEDTKQESAEIDKTVSTEDDKAPSAETDAAESAEEAKAEIPEDDAAASAEDDKPESKEHYQGGDTQDSQEDEQGSKEDTLSVEADAATTQDGDDSKDLEKVAEVAESKEEQDDTKEDIDDTKEDVADDSKEDGKSVEEETQFHEVDDKDEKESVENVQGDEAAKPDSKEDDKDISSEKATDADSKEDDKKDDAKSGERSKEDTDGDGLDESDEAPEEELILEIEVPDELRPRDHVEQLLKLDDESLETEKIVNRISEITLRELKKLYENAIKPLEVLYKYRDLSNRHFGDPEIFSKPLILFMGPWSGGKSSIINYLLDNEYNETALRTGAEPSPAYFNIMTYGEEHEIIEGTQLAADFTFSGLQKFGQGLEERLRGHKLPRKLLEKVNIVEIPGILEVRKQVSRVFPFNDACQWFIDRADIIFLVYDPSKLDVGPETEAILDQLKGREHQTRIILNKADQVKPEELMRVQGALIWNISPLMSSAQPPVMYTTSLWSRPYEPWAPVRLLQAQERAFLRDLRSAIDKRIENKIASARRFAVRVRNHAKMVDCYLTTYYNHKSVFGNKKQVADEIIEHPQDYHIYEGLSTLTNISRYDLPDPEVYRDFFKLNPLYEFQQLSATCTYFRGCPINRLDIAIAYDLPELVGKHRRLVESALAEAAAQTAPGS